MSNNYIRLVFEAMARNTIDIFCGKRPKISIIFIFLIFRPRKIEKIPKSKTKNLLTKIKSLLAVFSLVHFRHGKQTGIKSGLCFSINGFMLLGKPPSLVRNICAETCLSPLSWPVSCFCPQLLFSECSCIRCSLWVPDGS